MAEIIMNNQNQDSLEPKIYDAVMFDGRAQRKMWTGKNKQTRFKEYVCGYKTKDGGQDGSINKEEMEGRRRV